MAVFQQSGVISMVDCLLVGIQIPIAFGLCRRARELYSNGRVFVGRALPI